MKRRWRLRGATLLMAVSLGALNCRGQTSKSQTGGARAERAQPDTSAEVKRKVAESYGRLPLGFEANRGQTDPRVKFLSRGKGYTLFLTPREAVLALQKPLVPKLHSKLDALKRS